MTPVVDAWSRELFSTSICELLRESRRRQKLTQAQVADRTGGLISKAALANYETGHRSLRIDVLWVIAKALGESMSAMVAAAERGLTQPQEAGGSQSVRLDLAAVRDSDDPRLSAVRRWIELRPDPSGLASGGIVVLDQGAVIALAALLTVSQLECRRILSALDSEGVGESGVPSGLRSSDSTFSGIRSRADRDLEVRRTSAVGPF